MTFLIFDLDNTLYTFAETGMAKQFNKNNVEFIMQNLKMNREDAEAYFWKLLHEKGHPARGLIEHGIDPKVFTDAMLNVDHEKILKEDKELHDTLQRFQDDGWDMWVFTNADVTHSNHCLRVLGVLDFFRDHKTGDLKIIDCYEQWEHSVGEMHNKPEQSAYELVQKRVNAAPGDLFVMVEDTMKNLYAPHKLGWIPVWISHGRDLPKDDADQPPVEVIKGFHDLPALLDVVVPKEQHPKNRKNSGATPPAAATASSSEDEDKAAAATEE